MNVTELARKLKIPTKELLEVLPAVGFDIGRRAIKIDDRQAQRVIEQWPRLLVKYRELTSPEEAEVKASGDQAAAEVKKINIPSQIRVKDFAAKLNISLSKLMAELMKNGVLSSMNEAIDFDTAAIVGSELGFEIVQDTASVENSEQDTAHKLERLLSDSTDNLFSRPPVVVIMGHVDHGKTKLLDAIRKTNVMEGESGGITQHIGAYQVTVPSKEEASSRAERGISPRHSTGRGDTFVNRTITFIDTPGHEAFTTMRSRGARIADVAILVIAADDSIQPQTKESIKIIKSAGLPMIVAINKVDKPDANPEKVKQDLATMNLVPEEWGGKTIVVPISAKQGIGIDDLLDMILLVAETEKDQIVANPNKLAVGTIIESHLDRGEGPVATALIQAGTLKKGDLVEVSGNFYGKIRVMKDYTGKEIDKALPSTPARIIGLKAAPSVGDVLEVVSEVNKHKKLSKYHLTQQAVDYSRPKETTDEGSNNTKNLNLILRSDVLGSLEAIIASLSKLDNQEVAVNIIAKGLGNVIETDIERAAASKAIVMGFHVKVTQQAELLAKEKKVEVKNYDIIYKLLEDVHDRLEKMLVPEVIRTDLGRLKVLAVFRKEQKNMVVGGQVLDGQISANTKVDVMDGKFKKATGYVTQVQVNKVNVGAATKGQECGLSYDGKAVIEQGDILNVYKEEIKDKKLEN
ncbi:MAG: translation initiation factor IF-2 [Patescibacteria group bacterium]|jgi:translation initiation factor IF-2|nr:translation initiation factor IF-2 [Patescibacteria group bacterium]